MNTVTSAGPAGREDLSAVSWVAGELQRSLDTAHKALRRFLKEAQSVAASDVDSPDAAILRQARVQLHQSVGALELVGLPQPAKVLRASEAAVQRISGKPALLDSAAVEAIESASFAVIDYLQRLLAGRPASPVALFPQYRAVQTLAGVDRIHPADLWGAHWRWQPLAAEAGVAPRPADDAARGEMEGLVLSLMRRADAAGFQRTSDFCAGVAAGAASPLATTTWQLAAAFFDAQAHGLLDSDVYAKRMASRLLAQLRANMRAADEVSELLASDLLFFCARARAPKAGQAPRLQAVRRAWELDASSEVTDYESQKLGRFDPALLGQARKRVVAAKDAWSAVAGGDVRRLPTLAEPFALLADSLQRLFPAGEVLGSALNGAATQTVATGSAPPTGLAMEMATAVLWVDAALEEAALDAPELADRVRHVAQRVELARAGGDVQPLEPWIEELYRRVSDQQTMGSVVHELRASLTEVEKAIDQFFRNPHQREVLMPVPAQLQAMRGVLSVLDLKEASAAVVHMQRQIDELAATEIDPALALQAGTFDRLADNLGTLGFQIDMLSVQPALARSLFHFDPIEGRLIADTGGAPQPSGFGGLGPPSPVSLAPADIPKTERIAPPPSAPQPLALDPPFAPISLSLDEAPAPVLPPPAPLADVAQQLAAAAAEPAVSDRDLERQLAALSERAVVEDQASLARMTVQARIALQGAGDAAAKQAVRAELAQAVRRWAEPTIALAPPPPAPPVAVAPRPELDQPGAGATGLEEDDEMRGIFLEEAREVFGTARAALSALAANSEDVGEMTTVRRAFHTLKGSSRMVGLKEFGEAAWGCEQLYNARLASDPRVDLGLADFSRRALDELDAWIEDIEARRDGQRSARSLVEQADALRLGRPLEPATRVQPAPLAPTVEPAPPAPMVEPAPLLNTASVSPAPAPTDRPIDETLQLVPEDVEEPEPEGQTVFEALVFDPLPADPVDQPPPGVPSVVTPDDAEGAEVEPGEPAAGLAGASTLVARVPDLPSAADLDLGLPSLQGELDPAPMARANAASAPAAEAFSLDLPLLDTPRSAGSMQVVSPVASRAEPDWHSAPTVSLQMPPGAGQEASRGLGPRAPTAELPEVLDVLDASGGVAPVALPEVTEALGDDASAPAAPAGHGDLDALRFDLDLGTPDEAPTVTVVATDPEPLQRYEQTAVFGESTEVLGEQTLVLDEGAPPVGEATEVLTGPALEPSAPEPLPLSWGESEPLPAEATLVLEPGSPAVFQPEFSNAPVEHVEPLDVGEVSFEPLVGDAAEAVVAGGELPIELGEAIEIDVRAEPEMPGLDRLPPDAPLDDAVALRLPEVLSEAVELPLAPSAGEPVAETVVASAMSAEPAPAPERALDDDGTKLIGSLRIPIPLFNIFLNEADEQSRRLVTDLAEWALEWQKVPVPESSEALAHSLAGNSATVGYGELSGLARALEHAITRSRRGAAGRDGESELFTQAADEIRRLLHQFAAGFLKPVPEDLMLRLADHEHWPMPTEATDDGLTDEALQDLPLPEAPVDPDEGVAQPLVARDALRGDATEMPDIPDMPEMLDLSVEPAALEVPTDTSAPASPVDVPPAGWAPQAGPVAVAPVATGVVGDALDGVDEIDPELLPIFLEEADELLPQLQQRVGEWLASPSNRAAADGAMRNLHTFKGGARLAGAMRVGELAHRLESDIEHLLGAPELTADDLEPLQGQVDRIAQLFEALKAPAAPVESTDTAGEQLEHPVVPVEGPAGGLVAGVVDAPAEAPVDAPEDTAFGDLMTMSAAAAATVALLSGAEGADAPADQGLARHDAQAVDSGVDAGVGGDGVSAETDLTLDFGSEAGSPAALTGVPAVPEAVAPAPAPAPVLAPIDWSRFGAAAADRPGATIADAGNLQMAPLATSGVVRVRSGVLDRLVNGSGEVSIARARIEGDVRSLQASLGELTASLDRMRRELRDIELQAETQISARIEAAKASAQSFDPLEMDRFTRLQELTRMMAESVNDVATLQRSLQRTLQSTEDQLAAQARLTRELQEDLLSTRMTEFESLADRLYRVVRQAARDSGKQVKMEIVGGAIEVDRGVLERMAGPFEHLLRNSVAHGIEPADRRAALGKDRTGTITVQVTQAGNEVVVAFADDGAGLDLPRIRERAVERGLLAADAQPSDDELAQFIFRPGFSTASTVTELAGRGVGMDVVRSEINAMGGRIETHTEAGRGSRFRLVLPLTTAVTQVVMLRCGLVHVAVPSTLVEIVRRVPTAEVAQAYTEGTLAHDGEAVPFYWFAALLEGDPPGPLAGRTQAVVVIRSAAQRVALHIDEVEGNQEVVVKNLGPQLARMPGLAGVTLLPSGEVALIYNPVALAALHGAQVRARQQPPVPQPDLPLAEAAAGADGAMRVPSPSEPDPALPPLVMVVDDSLTVRRVTQRLLEREGYRVVLAKDGIEALERLGVERPRVMLCDIEMPRMDGFELVRSVRADPERRSIPVVMITSRIAQKHRDHAASLGVEHYLGKPFAEDQLLALVAQYCAMTPA